MIRQRGCPLHLANLWNTLYFNYDVGYNGFHADHLEQKRIPTRTAEARAFALPVGGFVRVHTEMACGDLLGEVIYKEGAHPSLAEGMGWIDSALSGAPASVTDEFAGQRVVNVCERFMLDLNAFGPDENSITAKQYERLCNNARWLDSHGHLRMEAMYGPDEAGLEDLDHYADYLLREHRDGLLAFCFNEELSNSELREALLRSFDAVREIANGARELRSWRAKYFFLESDYRERLENQNAVLGAGDLQTIYRGLTRVPTGESRCYAPIGPRIINLLEQHGMTSEEEALVRGSAYVTAVCHANTYIAGKLSTDVLASGVHLRLDDDWQAGGIWRAERVADPERYSLKAIPPLIPLGLGYDESARRQEVTETFTADEQPIAASQTGFRVVLTRRDRELGRLRLSREVAESLASGDVDMAIRHDETRERYPVERDGPALYGIRYPLALHPGVVLHCNIEGGGSVVRVRTVRVTPPVTASDGTRFDYDTNVGVYEREMALRQLLPAEKRGALSLTELINRAFRLRGRHREDGGRALTFDELATVILGPTWTPDDTRPLAEAVAAMGLERDGADYAWRPRVTSRTRSSDRSLLAAYGETEARGRLARSVRRHWVPMHLRRYTKRKPSAEKRVAYPEARKRFGMYGVLAEDLPENCTWVEPYSRGDDEGVLNRIQVADEGAELDANEPPAT